MTPSEADKGKTIYRLKFVPDVLKAVEGYEEYRYEQGQGPYEVAHERGYRRKRCRGYKGFCPVGGKLPGEEEKEQYA